MNNGNKEYGLIKTHIRSIETLVNKIPEKDHLSASNRKQLRTTLVELEEQLSRFKHWNEPRTKQD